MTGEIAVIIAARNASATIARAVRSALAEHEVAEVIVVDDGSTDDTAASARGADDGTGRLAILRRRQNLGPAAARNLAISKAQAPIIAILDADDYFLPGRFNALLEIRDWDLIADNILFVPEGRDELAPGAFQPASAGPARISLAAFIDANVSRRGRPRGELGFAKPLIRRAWLTGRAIAYDHSLRLGEDYALYARLLEAGARFLVSSGCGYVATIRANSLAANHRIVDLEALLRFDRSLSASRRLTREQRSALRRHIRQLEVKIHHRRVLAEKRKGLGRALAAALARPSLIPQLATAIARDKLTGDIGDSREVRYLLA
jgi:succinoglycan biosynthesis protein ExoU